MATNPLTGADPVTVWRKTEQWLGLGLSALVGMVAMAAMVTLGLYVSSAAHVPLLAYIFFAAGVGFSCLTTFARALEFYRMPVRMGYDAKGIHLEYRRGRLETLGYGELLQLAFAQYVSGWYLEAETSEGERFTTGADRTEEFARNLLEAYARHLRASGKSMARVETKRGTYPSRRMLVATDSG